MVAIPPAPYYKRTPETLQAICDSLRQGCTRRAACASADLNFQILYDWMRADEHVLDAIVRAEQEAERKATVRVTSAFEDKDTRVATQNAQWWLERRRRQDYGPSLDLGKIPTERLVELLQGAPDETDYTSVQSLRRQRLLAENDAQTPVDATTMQNAPTEPNPE